jgi:hypothetical protein
MKKRGHTVSDAEVGRPDFLVNATRHDNALLEQPRNDVGDLDALGEIDSSHAVGCHLCAHGNLKRGPPQHEIRGSTVRCSVIGPA